MDFVRQWALALTGAAALTGCALQETLEGLGDARAEYDQSINETPDYVFQIDEATLDTAHSAPSDPIAIYSIHFRAKFNSNPFGAVDLSNVLVNVNHNPDFVVVNEGASFSVPQSMGRRQFQDVYHYWTTEPVETGVERLTPEVFGALVIAIAESSCPADFLEDELLDDARVFVDQLMITAVEQKDGDVLAPRSFSPYPEFYQIVFDEIELPLNDFTLDIINMLQTDSSLIQRGLNEGCTLSAANRPTRPTYVGRHAYIFLPMNTDHRFDARRRGDYTIIPVHLDDAAPAIDDATLETDLIYGDDVSDPYSTIQLRLSASLTRSP